MEIFGTCYPKKSHISTLIQSIEMNLTIFTIQNLTKKILIHNGQLTKEDFCYIENGDQRLYVAFPLDEGTICDSYSLLKYLK
jgi:hypothetical protein